MIDFTSIKALSFDCYGTLIDWEQGILTALRPWIVASGAKASDADLLNLHAEFETKAQAADSGAPYPIILQRVHAMIAERLGLSSNEAEAVRFGASIGRWPPFPDSQEALERLGRRFKLIIASNIDRASFDGSQRRLGVSFDEIITAEDVGAYKPDHAHFREIFRRLEAQGIARGQLVHVAQSLYHDHVPAKQLGLPSVWINRASAVPGGGATPQAEGADPTMEFPTMAAFADEVDRQFAAVAG